MKNWQIYNWVCCVVVLGLLVLQFKLQSTRLKMVLVIVCVAIMAYSEFRLGSVARYVVQKRVDQGTWTKPYSEGVVDIANALAVDWPITFASVTALAILAWRGGRSKATADNSQIPPTQPKL